MISFDENGNGNWGASRNSVIQSDFNSRQKLRICFSLIKLFSSEIGHYFWTPQEKGYSNQMVGISFFVNIFHRSWFSFAPFIQKTDLFFHSKSKRWKLWGKIYWKLHFLDFLIFCFCKYFRKILKRREILVVFSWGIFLLDGIFNHVFWEIFDLLRSFLWYSFSVWIGRN